MSYKLNIITNETVAPRLGKHDLAISKKRCRTVTNVFNSQNKQKNIHLKFILYPCN